MDKELRTYSTMRSFSLLLTMNCFVLAVVSLPVSTSFYSSCFNCQPSGVHTNTIKVAVGENLDLGFQVVMWLNVLLVHESENGTCTNIMSISEGQRRTPYIDHSYQGRAVVYERNQNNIKIRISDIRPSDGGTFFIKVEGQGDAYRECDMVYVLGLPTTPAIYIVVSDTDTYTKVRCNSTSTTVPKSHPWKLKYFYKVNNIDVLPGDDSRFSVSGNTLMIVHGQDEPSIRVTCIVNEGINHSKNVSSFMVLPTYQTETSEISEKASHKGSCAKAMLNPWAMVCCFIFLIVLSGR